jgi:hypothetical protein
MERLGLSLREMTVMTAAAVGAALIAVGAASAAPATRAGGGPGTSTPCAPWAKPCGVAKPLPTTGRICTPAGDECPMTFTLKAMTYRGVRFGSYLDRLVSEVHAKGGPLSEAIDRADTRPHADDVLIVKLTFRAQWKKDANGGEPQFGPDPRMRPISLYRDGKLLSTRRYEMVRGIGGGLQPGDCLAVDEAHRATGDCFESDSGWSYYLLPVHLPADGAWHAYRVSIAGDVAGTAKPTSVAVRSNSVAFRSF